MELNREILKSSTKIRRRKIERLLAVCSLVIVVLIDISIILSRLDNLQIKKVDISGNKDVSALTLFDEVKNLLSGRYLGFYPRSNFLIYPKGEIIKRISSFPNVESLNIAVSSKTLYLVVKEREPKYLWCGDFDTSEYKRCFYVDSGGYSYGLAPDFSSHIFFEFYGGDKRGGYSGKTILPAEQFSNVVLLADYLKKLVGEFISPSAELYGANLKQNGDVDFLVEDRKALWIIKTTISSEPSLIAQKMEKAISSPVFQKELEEKKNLLAYIDLRFGKKVFYKFGQ